MQCGGQPVDVGCVGLQYMEGEPLSALGSDAGKSAEFVDGAVNASSVPERDLSVQLSGWMLMEAAFTVSDE